MTALSKTLFGAAMGAGVLAFSVVSAPAAVVCNDTVCWHTHDKVRVPAGCPREGTSGQLALG